MLDQLVLWEKSLFLWLNGHHTPYWDVFMYLISAPWSWTAIVVLMLCWVWWKRSPREALLFILFVLLMMAFSDQLSSGLAKPFFARERPTYHLYTQDEVAVVFGDKGAGWGFFSGHATNFFAIATFTALAFRRRSYSLVVYTLVTIVAYSRIYLGKHFISDVVVGICAGLLVGWLFFTLYSLARRRLFEKKLVGYKQISKATSSLFSSNINYLTATLILFLFFLLFFSLDIVRILKHISYISS